MQECLRNEPGARGRRPCLLAGARNVPAARPRLAEPLPAHGRRSRTRVHGIVAERGVRRRGAQVAPRGGRAAISLTRPRMACSPAHASAPARGISLGSFASQPDDPGHSAGRAPLTFVFHSHSLRFVIPPVPKASHMSSRSLAPACERSARDAGAFPAPFPAQTEGPPPPPPRRRWPSRAAVTRTDGRRAQSARPCPRGSAAANAFHDGTLAPKQACLVSETAPPPQQPAAIAFARCVTLRRLEGVPGAHAAARDGIPFAAPPGAANVFPLALDAARLPPRSREADPAKNDAPRVPPNRTCHSRREPEGGRRGAEADLPRTYPRSVIAAFVMTGVPRSFVFAERRICPPSFQREVTIVSPGKTTPAKRAW